MLTFAPDLDQTQPGILVEATNLVPTPSGYEASPTAYSGGAAALPGECVGSFQTVKLDGSYRLFAGTATKIYEKVGAVWSDVSRATDYAASSASPWRMCMFGDSTLAASSGSVIQRATIGNFADIAGSPQAALIDSADGFVMVANTGSYTDEWHCSAFRDETNWTPSIATQSAKGRLVDSPGPIVGLRALGGNFVAYKARSMFFGVYAGGAEVWEWTRLPGSVGAVANESIISLGVGHYFIGADDVWFFDGSRPVPIGGPVRKWLFSRINPAYAYKIRSMHDRTNGLIYWFYPTTDSTLDSALIYNYKLDRFGHLSLPVECVVETAIGGYTIDGLDSISATIDGLPDIPMDSPYWSASSPRLGIFDTTHTFKTLTGPASSSGLVTGAFGDDAMFQMVSRVQPRMARQPTSGGMTHQYADALGENWQTAGSSVLLNQRFDSMWSSRWHRFAMTFTGPMEITNYKIFATQDGTE